MERAYRAAPGVAIMGMSLPNGDAPSTITVDNHSGYWYQVAPIGAWVTPYTTGVVIGLPGTAIPDLIPMPKGPAGQVSTSSGDQVQVTASDADVSTDRGNSLAWAAPGILRYLGKLSQTGDGTATTTVTIQPNEQSIVLVSDVVYGSGIAGKAWITGATSGVQSQYGAWSPGGNLNGPARFLVSSQIDTQWQVSWNLFGSGGATRNLYMFASTDPAPPSNVADSLGVMLTSPNGLTVLGFGQQVMASSLPVAIASDQAAGRSGPQTGANSLPIVYPTDTFPYSGGARKPYDQQATISASNAIASIVLAATPNRRWVLDYMSLVLLNVATVAGGPVTPTITDSINGVVWQEGMGFASAANAHDRVILGPGWGLVSAVGASLTIAIPAGGASTVGRASVGAYLLPVGL